MFMIIHWKPWLGIISWCGLFRGPEIIRLFHWLERSVKHTHLPCFRLRHYFASSLHFCTFYGLFVFYVLFYVLSQIRVCKKNENLTNTKKVIDIFIIMIIHWKPWLGIISWCALFRKPVCFTGSNKVRKHTLVLF